MATVTGTIQETGQQVTINLPTVRIPELAQISEPLDGADQIAVYDQSLNSTRRHSLDAIRDYMTTGGEGTGLPATVSGNRIEIVVDASNKVGNNRVTSTLLTGKQFNLERVGYGPLLSAQFSNLPSGGFDLLDDTVRLGDVFIAELFETVSEAPGGAGQAVVSTILSGIALIADDTLLNSLHYNKLLHVSNNTKNLLLTLPDIGAAPANLILPFETSISNGYFTKLQTQAGQLIYFNGTGVTSLWLGANEFLWLVRGTDGWYVMKASESILNVGQPFMDYAERANTAKAKGQLVARDAYPRLVAWLLQNANAYVTEATWQAAGGLNKGKFSLGDGATTFRFPDHQGLIYRALKNEGGSDADRPGNTPGLIQSDMVGPHTHSKVVGGLTYDRILTVTGTSTVSGPDNTAGEPNLALSATMGDGGGTETRMRNLGLIPLIRV